MEEYLKSVPGVGAWLWPTYMILRALFIALDIVLVFLFVYAFKKAVHYRPKFDLGKNPKRQLLSLRNSYFRKRWGDLIKKYTEPPNVDSMRLAVLEADSLVDRYLKDLQFPGEHFADRFAYMDKQQLKSVDGVWEAHRLRNDIAHGKSVSLDDATSAFKSYGAFFKEIGVLKIDQNGQK
ncbi:MAG: hypothetical protein V1489_01390 [Candidatus Liptonbacteria bacterium]